MGFKSTDCIGQGINWRTHSFSLLLMYLWQSLQVIILHEYQSLSHKPLDANLRLYNWQKTPDHNKASFMLYGWFDTGNCSSFTKPFAAHRTSYLSQSFRTFIRQSKGHYFTVLLSILSVPWPFDIVLLLQQWFLQFYHIGQVHSISETHFFTTLVQLCSDVWSSQLSVTQAGN